jgi:hypothetical protein
VQDLRRQRLYVYVLQLCLSGDPAREVILEVHATDPPAAPDVQRSQLTGSDQQLDSPPADTEQSRCSADVDG